MKHFFIYKLNTLFIIRLKRYNFKMERKHFKKEKIIIIIYYNVFDF
jgi:hypothetical protein